MAEVLLQFDPAMTDETGVTYVVRICGRVAEDGLWEGWIEFDPQDGGTTLRTPTETQQPNRVDLEYWATGLTVSYLEGALERARHPKTPDLRPRTVVAHPTYDRPDTSTPTRTDAGVPQHLRPHAVIDPFEVYSQSEDVLRAKLSAVSEGHLRNIIRAYALASDEMMDLLPADRPALAEAIIATVRKKVG